MNHKNGITSDEILAKKFRADVKGYDAEEVDTFLDRVIETLVRFETFAKNEVPQLEKAGTQLDKLAKRNQELEIELAILKDKFDGLSANDTLGVNQNNLELHKRIGQLEKALYQLGQDPTKIK
ncbi:MAG: DivIVA domain-containing protein [Bacilli bacterium]|jgi:DivIVA domain-containing protein